MVTCLLAIDLQRARERGARFDLLTAGTLDVRHVLEAVALRFGVGQDLRGTVLHGALVQVFSGPTRNPERSDSDDCGEEGEDSGTDSDQLAGVLLGRLSGSERIEGGVARGWDWLT